MTNQGLFFGGKALLFLALFLSAPGITRGGGFQMVDQSARAMGIGGAVGALIGDPTAMNSNPALLSFLEGTIFSLGATVNVPDERFYGVSPMTAETKMQPQVLFPPSICLSYTSPGGFAAGISVTVPYEMQTEWDPNWVGSRLVVKSDLRVAMVTPAISVRFSDDLSAGIGINLGLPRILYEQRFPFAAPANSIPRSDGDVTYDGSGNVCYGVLIGLFYHVGDFLSMGASYRSHMNLAIDDGRVRYRGTDSVALSPEGKFSTALVLPNQFLVGAVIHPFSWLNVYGDLEFSLWSEFSSVRIKYADPTLPDVLMNQDWSNTANARIGLEAAFSEFSVRAGIRFEKSPVPDATLSPGLPDATGTGYSLGFGYKAGEGLVLDFAYSLMRYNDRRITDSSIMVGPYVGGFNGVYSSQTASLAINVTYSWN